MGLVQRLQQTLSDAGIVLWTVGNVYIGKNPDIILGREGRDRGIQRFKDFLVMLKQAKVHCSIFTWEPEGVVSTHYAKVRGDSTGRAVDLRLLNELKSVNIAQVNYRASNCV